MASTYNLPTKLSMYYMYVYTYTIAYIHKYSYSPHTLQAIFREKKKIKGPAPRPISHRIREYYIAQGTENPKIESSILEPLAQQASSLPLSQLSFYQIERIETPNLFPMVYHVLPIPSKKIFFFLIVCFTSYFVFSIAVLPHSPRVVYYHLLLRRETRIPELPPSLFE